VQDAKENIWNKQKGRKRSRGGG